MSRRKLLVLSLITSLVFLAILWHHFFRLPLLPVHPFEAAPATSAIVLAFPGPAPLDSGSLEATALARWLSVFPDLEEDLSYFQESLAEAGIIPDANRPMALLLLKTGSREPALTAIVDIRGSGSNPVAALGSLAGGALQSSRYRGYLIYRLPAWKGRGLAFARYRNLLLLGRLPLCVEESVAQLSDFQSHPEFRKLQYRQEKGAFCSIYLNSMLLPDFFAGALQKSRAKEAENLWASFNWLRLDVVPDSAKVKLSGKMIPSPASLLEAAPDGTANPSEAVFRIIPDDVVFAARWRTPRMKSFLRDALPGGVTRFERFVLPWAEEEIALALTDPYAVSSQGGWAILVKYGDRDRAEKSLEAMADEVGFLQSFDYQTYPVRQLLDESLFSPLLKPRLANPFFTFVEDYVVFANSRSGLEIIIDKHIVGKTLAANPAFLTFYEENRDSEGILSWYVNTGSLAPLLYEYLDPPFNERIAPLLKELEKFGYAGLKFSRQGQAYLLQGRWTPAPIAEQRGGVVWRTYLAREAVIPPSVVDRGKGKGKTVFIQDAAHTLYCLSAEGAILWRKELDGPVLSDFIPVDHYQDGNRQLLFNTRNKVYLIDLTGKDQAVFPLSIQADALAGLTAVDFEGNREYVFFVPCANGYIYGYDKRGGPLQGWSPQTEAGRVRHPLSHFWYGGKDYLIALNESGTLHAFGRNGVRRFPPAPLKGPFLSPLYYQASGDISRIAAGDVKGVVHAANLQGETFTLRLQIDTTAQARFLFADIVGDSRNDYIALAGSEVTAYSYSDRGFERVFRTRMDYAQDTLFAVNLPGRPKSFIGTLRRDKRLVYLLDGKGNVLPGFPLAGSTAFVVEDLFGNGENVVVVGEGRGVGAYSMIE
jgi:hypothetical protein